MYDRIQTPKFLAVIAAGAALVFLVAFTAPPPFHTALLGVLLVAILVLVWVGLDRNHLGHVKHLATPMTLAKDEEVFHIYTRAAEALKQISNHRDPILRDLTLHRAEQVAGELAALADRRIVFVGTEAWRAAYERLLRSPGLHLYRSVAVIETKTYWQDEPGKQSMQLNLELVDEAALNIERIVVIADDLWPASEHFPLEPVREWIETQHNHGMWIKLVRRSEIANEPQLIVDLGIYGNRAVGVQELDERGRTVRFTLSFDFEKVLSAEQRWDRLTMYATSYRDLLDRKGGSS